jgi:hypothetical protein
MKNVQRSVMFFAAIVGVAGMLALFGWKTSAPTSEAASAAYSQTDKPPSNVSEKPDSIEESDRAETKHASNDTASSDPRPPRPPYFVAIKGDERGGFNSWSRLDPLTRILSPTSAEDERWLLRNRYPQPAEYRAIQDPSVIQTQIDDVMRAGNLAEATRLNDLLAAYFYEKGDDQWRMHAKFSESPFAKRLLAEDMVRTYEPGLTNVSELVSLISWTQAMGDPNVVAILSADIGIRIDVERHLGGASYMAQINAVYRQLSWMRQLHESKGRIPYSPPSTIRPQPTWGRKF